jgi:hypothetical protein
MKFRVFWDVEPCSHVEVERRFRDESLWQLALSGKSHAAGLPPFAPVQPLVTLLVFSAPWFLPPRLSLLRWQVPPHFQHNCRLFLWLSVGLDRVNTDAVGASLTGISSWPVVAHGIPRPLSRGKPAGYPDPGWTLPLHRRRTPKYWERAVPESALSAPLSRRGSSVPNQLACLLRRGSSVPNQLARRTVDDDVWSSDNHEFPSVDGHTSRLFLHPADIDRSVLGPRPGTFSQAPPARHTALIFLSSRSSTSLLLAGTRVSKLVEMSDNELQCFLLPSRILLSLAIHTPLDRHNFQIIS